MKTTSIITRYIGIGCLMIGLIAISSATTVFGQAAELSATAYRLRVLDYSRQLRSSSAEADAMREAVRTARTAFFPAVDMAGNYQYRFNSHNMQMDDSALPIDNNNYTVEAGVSQPVYAGGQIYNSYKAAQIQSEIARENELLTTDNVIRSADVCYWSAAANQRLYEVMCEYYAIVKRLADVLAIRYTDGQISKTDLLQVQSRLKEAELSRSTAHKDFRIALQSLNTLMGVAPMDEVALTDSISTYCLLPLRAGDDVATGNHDDAAISNRDEAAISNRPDYRIALLDIDYQKRQVKLAAARYNPTVAIGFKESWGTPTINTKGADRLWNSVIYASVQIPLFRWGARFRERNTQKAILRSKEYAADATRDRISQEVAAAWTNLTEYGHQIGIAESSCLIAAENLDLNTFSYTEGKLPIVDVLSAQLSWIQAYSGLIQVWLQQKVSLADYNKAVGNRP